MEFTRLTSLWKLIEALRGFYAKLKLGCTYKAEELPDENSGWWVEAYTEFIARTLTFLLLDAYDHLHTWVVSRDKCRLARELNLEPISWSMNNVTKAMHIVGVVENTRFDTFTERWHFQGIGYR